VLVFGIWLAIYVDAYQVWDGWVLAAIVLWVVASAVGGRIGRGYRRMPADAASDDSRALMMHVVLVLSVLALLVDMIYKPGAG